MKELASAFDSEVFRPLMTLIVPGCVAIAPWTILTLALWPDLKQLATTHYYEAVAIFLVIAISTGMLLEDWGSWVEGEMDKRRDRHGKEHTRDWYRYLRLSFVTEPIGHRYLRTLVLRLKFELGTGMGLITSGVGVCVLAIFGSASLMVGTLLILFGVYLILWEAFNTHERLGELRAQLLNAGCSLWGDRSVKRSDRSEVLLGAKP